MLKLLHRQGSAQPLQQQQKRYKIPSLLILESNPTSTQPVNMCVDDIVYKRVYENAYALLGFVCKYIWMGDGRD